MSCTRETTWAAREGRESGEVRAGWEKRPVGESAEDVDEREGRSNSSVRVGGLDASRCSGRGSFLLAFGLDQKERREERVGAVDGEGGEPIGGGLKQADEDEEAPERIRRRASSLDDRRSSIARERWDFYQMAS